MFDFRAREDTREGLYEHRQRLGAIEPGAITLETKYPPRSRGDPVRFGVAGSGMGHFHPPPRA